MPSKIRVLDDQTINAIAAGEVIENPASVVKELIENARDAGSSEICVEIKGGGRSLIRVTDNGCGMNGDDALLCLERHATSKIRSLDDLQTLFTMGFRGEAIPSIASISKFTLTTREMQAEMGTLVQVEGGKLIKTAQAACAAGTTIEVRELFFNVPVRKKFLKSPTHDSNEVEKVVMLAALSQPSIKYTLIENEKIKLKTGGGDFGERIRAVLGEEFASSLRLLDKKMDTFHLQGYVGIPSYTRQNKTGQYLFINQRAVQSPFVSFAVRDGYGTMLSPQRYPVFVLSLSIPGTDVDVNVHPQKREVRLRQEEVLKKLIHEGIRDALQEEEISTIPESPILPPFDWKIEESAPMIVSEPIFSYEPHQGKQIQEDLPWEFPIPVQEEKKKESVRILGTMQGYILLDKTHEGLSLIDQQAAHSRVLFERLQKGKDRKIETQPLLVPLSFSLTRSESAQLRESLWVLNDIGFQIREIGQHSFVVDAIPSFFQDGEVVDLIRGFMDGQNRKLEKEQKNAHIAMRLAIPSKKRLSHIEAEVLVTQLMDCDCPLISPTGKPTMITLKPEDVSTLFMKK
jgi:DNA mismatch repair protein MutL